MSDQTSEVPSAATAVAAEATTPEAATEGQAPVATVSEAELAAAKAEADKKDLEELTQRVQDAAKVAEELAEFILKRIEAHRVPDRVRVPVNALRAHSLAICSIAGECATAVEPA